MEHDDDDLIQAPGLKTSLAEALEQGYPPETRIENATLGAFIASAAAIAALAVAGPIAGSVVVAIAIVGTFLPIVWPDEIWTGLVNNMIGLTQPLIDRAILNAAIAQANATLRENQALCNTVSNTLNTWVETRTQREILVAQYAQLVSSYPAKLEQFLRVDFRSDLLAQYVNSVLVYLSVLSAFYPHADELRLNARGFSTAKEMVLKQIRDDTAKFTNVALATYKIGLQKIIDRGKNSVGENLPTWDDYNEYRLKMTIAALDFVSKFPYFDPVLYANGYAEKFNNRTLLTFFDTNKNMTSSSFNRKNILEFEKKTKQLRPVQALQKLTLVTGRFISTTSYYHVVDGLYRVQCQLRSLDGFDALNTLPEDGEPAPRDSGTIHRPRRIDINFFPLMCFYVLAHYWNGMIRDRDWDMHNYLRTLTEFAMLFQSKGDLPFSNNELATDLSEWRNPAARSLFRQSVPATELVDPSKSNERLSELRIFVDVKNQSHGYLFSWIHKNAVQDLLPRQNHVEDARRNPVEQFHAVRSAVSIGDDRLRIIDGPGFTGGDLVEVRPATGLRFKLQRIPGRWFAGIYRVRIWFIKPPSQASVRASATPTGDFISSFTDLIIPSASSLPNMDELKYADLSSLMFPGLLLLTAAMPTVTLELRNRSLAGNIVIDRFELIFDKTATYSELAE